jgi:hypothetical protein
VMNKIMHGETAPDKLAPWNVKLGQCGSNDWHVALGIKRILDFPDIAINPYNALINAQKVILNKLLVAEQSKYRKARIQHRMESL